ncbi:transmembrane protein 65-like [Anguilla anguilla]|uniref:transmembrane protein 65-like n=1 Tax=Anguilla anguilla TaxID=7936 RepID=UPI0015B2DC93|nr:transmembrane protein 65-like [Anguilla anguilla]XP_035238077.1 transmembrane protein 65-like [Anguilla anguilla]
MMLSRLQRVLRPILFVRPGVTLGRASENRTLTARKPLSMMFLQSCDFGTHPHKEPMEPLNSPRGARDFIYSLHPTERTCLLRELHRFECIAIAQEKLEMAPPTTAQLRYVLLHNAIPFVGFGFLDNAIMIVAGTQIELSIGVILGISTMAAAALGNLVSDLAGLGLAGYVEALACRLGMQIPDLTPKQADMWQTRVSSHTGKAIGVGIGCILGMFPLLFFKDEDEKKQAEGSELSTVSSSN